MTQANEKYKGDALLQKTYTVDFLSKKRAENDGDVPQYYVENSHLAIIDKDTWEAVQLEIERRRAYAEKHHIQKVDYATDDNPFAGRIICGNCGRAYGRKVWNSTDERLRRIIWWCNNKYVAKGEKGCGSRHIDDQLLYITFVNTFNAVVENKNYFMAKWTDQSNGDDILKRVIAKRFIDIFKTAKPIDRFDVDLCFKLTEKITVYDGELVVSLRDGSEIECEIE
ncbi:Site-specific recombinase [Desulfosporosinus sp. I2]|uniref:recombinase zinc beta ribbon domain-containing protein n=1 Tax=Desulfosporosinus sp. I2 TaxID=1617025 RepID=UPI0005EEB166|nr:recombinase zinc beta ribbon domain-containing protein [Desulfosporosinus sp. I2]KJR44909.1 Site-specific recombinase [Desulfosporosinus sp. I2]